MQPPDLGPNASDLFRAPSHQEYVDLLTSPEEPQVHPEEIRHAHEQFTAQLLEDADRLAQSSERQQFNDIIDYSYNGRPEVGTPPELDLMSEVGREVTRMRTDRISQQLKQQRLLNGVGRLMGKGTGEKTEQLFEGLVNREGHSAIAEQIFGTPPEGKVWKFYYENSNRKDEWFFLRLNKLTSTPESVVRYVREPNHVRKVENGERSEVLSQQELSILAEATKRYQTVIARDIYGEKLTRRGERKRAKLQSKSDHGLAA